MAVLGQTQRVIQLENCLAAQSGDMVEDMVKKKKKSCFPSMLLFIALLYLLPNLSPLEIEES